MASERLTISEKDRIAKSIIKPLIEQSKKNLKILVNLLTNFSRKIYQKMLLNLWINTLMQ
jgi:hypothetical protein